MPDRSTMCQPTDGGPVRPRSRWRRLLAAVFAVLAVSAACAETAPAPDPAGEASEAPPEGDAATEGIEGVVALSGLERNHVEGTVEYDAYPPLGGSHNPVWHNCGHYDEAIPDELAVHSMEHGAVWVAYRPDLPREQVEAIGAAAADDDQVLAAPYPGLRAPVVLTAWGRQLDLEGTDDPRFAEFVDTYVDSVAPEADAPCSGGVG